MTPRHPHAAPMPRPAGLARKLLPLLSVCAWLAHAATTEISDQPLIHANNTQQPNLMFLLDNSGSMDSDFLPENTGNTANYSVWSWHCNSLAFHPVAIPGASDAVGLYAPPVTPDGRAYPTMPVGAAWDNGFQPTFSGTTYTSTTSVDTNAVAALTGGNTVTITTALTTSTFAAKGSTVVLQQGADTSVTPNLVADPSHWLLGKVTNLSTSGKITTYTIALSFSSFKNGTVKAWTLGKPSTINLANNTYYQHVSDPTTAAEPTRPWKYTSTGTLDTTDTFVKTCLSTVDSAPSTFTKRTVSIQNPDVQQQYANWYSYYRTRILMMRTAAGRAMNGVPSNFRVGFSALNMFDAYGSASANSRVVDEFGRFASVSSYNDAQRLVFYSNLYGGQVGGSTPLRYALAKIGQYYGNRLTKTGNVQVDPIISSCQRNYTLLTTDGYWNDSSSYSPPKQLDLSTAIGNPDALASTPYYDGSYDYQDVEQRTNYELDTNPANMLLCGSKKAYHSYTEQRTNIHTPSGTTTGTWTRVSGSTGSLQCGTALPTATAPKVTSSTQASAPNTLADVAYYYQNTDLRSDRADQVPTTSSDPNKFQHMNTFTLGLGLSGQLPFTNDYASAPNPCPTTGSAAFNSLSAGQQTFCKLQDTSLTPRLYWPAPPQDTSDNPAKIDDLWHAAVNGRGQYFSATNAANLSSALITTVQAIRSQTAAGSSAATTSLRPVLGTDQVFVAQYHTVKWTGEIKAKTITTNANSTRKDDLYKPADNDDWTVSKALTARTAPSPTDPTPRTIYYMRRANSTLSLGAFDWTTLSTDSDNTLLQGYFNGFCNKTPKPSQCADMSGSDATTASGANLVNFIRGDGTYEGTLYRRRLDAEENSTSRNVMGDIVDASPVYVGKPPFSYTGNSYSTWKNADAQQQRCPMVYAAANDGMLHAFSARTASSADTCPTAGKEVWAYVPRGVMSNLYRLADSQYADLHIFTVNGGPVVGDVSEIVTDTATGKPKPVWHSILVGGLGAGGKTYYALDVTSPVPNTDGTTGPKALWEFSDPDLGLTYGNPIITQVWVPDPSNTSSANATKLSWCVVFTSGLNNSGNGYLYVLDALTGTVVYKVPTLANNLPVGTASSPSGLNKLAAWVTTPSDNVTEYFYAVDLLGEVWRFDAAHLARAADDPNPDQRAVLLATLSKNGKAQPITVRPELAEVLQDGVSYRAVMVGTGRYLGTADAADTTTPSTIYGIKDPLNSTGWPAPIRNAMVGQTLGDVQTRWETNPDKSQTQITYRTITTNKVDWSSTAGWYVDLPQGAGERVAVPMSLTYNTLAVASLIPNNVDQCSNGGDSWLYVLDIDSGASHIQADKDHMQGGTRSDAAIMGISTVEVSNSGQSGRLITDANGNTYIKNFDTPSVNQVRRTSWRELTR